jgi:hypothetical protein
MKDFKNITVRRYDGTPVLYAGIVGAECSPDGLPNMETRNFNHSHHLAFPDSAFQKAAQPHLSPTSKSVGDIPNNNNKR